MDDKLKQAEEIPVPAADQAKEEDPSEAPTTVAEQGSGNVADSDMPYPESGDLQDEAPAAPEARLDDEESIQAETPATFQAPVADEESIQAETPAALASVADEEPISPEAPVADEAPSQGETATAAGESEREVLAADEEQAEASEPVTGEDTQAAFEAQLESTAMAEMEDTQAAFEAQPESTAMAEMTVGAGQAPEREMTMEDLIAASDDQLGRRPIHRGMLISGTVIMLSQEGVIVDVGAKIEGLIPYNQLFEFEVKPETAARYIKPGDEVQVYVVRADIPNGVIVLSKKRADQERAWNLLQEIHEKKLPVEVEIVDKVRGGLVANLGVRAFLPASQVDVRRVSDLSPYVGKRLKVRIIELNRKRNRVIISRRSIVEEEIADQKSETLRKLEPGAKLQGEVVEITDFGVFVNLGGVDGLVHRSEIGYGRFNHPREVLKVGDRVEVEVLDMNLERERINLSMKRLLTDPWETVLTKYHIGQKIAGKVTSLTPFGAFVELEPGLEGLIHVSEMSWTKRVRHPREVVKEGDEVEAMILKIDLEQKRISLGLRQTQPDPWSSLPDRFPPGTEVTGPVTGLTDFGVFMEIEEGIEGLIHISELAHERIDNVSEHFKKGDEVSAVILNIDPIEQRASLSRKRLLPYTAGDVGETAGYGRAPAGGRQGGGRKGRRGGRRSEIDYDYSYAAADAGGRTTTKLGDVYADLFAQFGLTDKPARPAEAPPEQEKVEVKEAPEAHELVEAERPEPVEDKPVAAETTFEPVQESAEAPAAAELSGEREEAADENVIDAAEAAALLTAAFRQGRRPTPEGEAERPEEDKVEENSKA